MSFMTKSPLFAFLFGFVLCALLAVFLTSTVTIREPTYFPWAADEAEEESSSSSRRRLFGNMLQLQPEEPRASDAVLRAFSDGPDRFKKLAYSVVAPDPPTDKVSTHSYQTMYGLFLYPLLARARRYNMKIKFFEIGMGCGMIYPSGKSVAVWKALFGEFVDLWEADLDPNCVKRQIELGKLKGVNMLVGNQQNPVHVNRWIQESGGRFDVIIDDGGHFNHEIKAAFELLWPQLNPGGLYFIEDLAVGRMIHDPKYGHYDETKGEYVISDIIQSWIDQLLIPDEKVGSDPAVKALRVKHPVPSNVKWIFCQAEACVLAKCLENDSAMCTKGVLKGVL